MQSIADVHPSVTVLAADVLVKANVTTIFSNGEIQVQTVGGCTRMLCDFLQTGDTPTLTLASGDLVLVFPPNGNDQKGVICGRIGKYVKPSNDKVVLEATNQLTLKCGDSSVTLHKDGKVVTQSKDIVSHARRRNRIKGGSVQIN